MCSTPGLDLRRVATHLFFILSYFQTTVKGNFTQKISEENRFFDGKTVTRNQKTALTKTNFTCIIKTTPIWDTGKRSVHP